MRPAASAGPGICHALRARHEDHALHGEGDREVEQDRGVAEAGAAAAVAAGQVRRALIMAVIQAMCPVRDLDPAQYVR
jgi:hypothetical protein